MLDIKIYTFSTRSTRYTILASEVFSLVSEYPKSMCAEVRTMRGIFALWAMISHRVVRLPFIELNGVVVRPHDLVSLRRAIIDRAQNEDVPETEHIVSVSPRYKSIAIFGASNKPHTYSYKAVQVYTDAGYKVFPINLYGGSVYGQRVYSSIRDIHEPIDIVSIYLPPGVVRTVINDIYMIQPKVVYLNPGSHNHWIKRTSARHGIAPIYECSIHALKQEGS